MTMPKRKTDPITGKPIFTEREQKFIYWYPRLKNGRKAAIKAGYSPTSAYDIASKNLDKPEIAEAIAERFERQAMKRDEVLARVGAIARADISDLLSELFTAVDEAEAAAEANIDNTGVSGLKPPSKLVTSSAVLQAIIDSEYSFLVKAITPQKDGSYRIELHDSMRALELIGKNLKLWTDTLEIRKKPVTADELDDSELEAIIEEDLRRKAEYDSSGE